LVGHLEEDQPIFGVLSQAFFAEDTVLMRVEELAAYYAQAIQVVCPYGPYHFLGFSFGGYVAFEIAQLLQARGEQVGMLGMLDSLRMVSAASSGVPVARSGVVALRSRQILKRVKELKKPGRFHYLKREIRIRILKFSYGFLYARGKPVPRFLRRPNDINWFAGRRYVPRFYPGKVTLFQAAASANQPHSTDELWGKLCGQGVEVVGIPGSHDDILREPNVRSLAKALTDCLTNARPTSIV
jgi:thioesterase domain-containing protein